MFKNRLIIHFLCGFIVALFASNTYAMGLPESNCQITALELIKKTSLLPQIGDTLRCELNCQGEKRVEYVRIDTIIVNDAYSKQLIFECNQKVDTFMWVDLTDLFKEKRDKPKFEFNNLVLPTASYSPETDWKFGLVGAHFFHIDSAALSSVQYGADYSLNKQWSLFGTTHLNFEGKHPWRLYTKIHYTSYPNYYYGVALSKKELFDKRIPYLSKQFELKVQPQWRIKKTHFYVGPALHIRYEDAKVEAKEFSHNTLLNSTEGFILYTQIGFGGLVSYDSRDLKEYPHSGTFMKCMLHQYSSYVWSDYSYLNIDLDWRYFEDFNTRSFVWANQFKSTWNSSSKIPFQLMPTLGGMDLMRGMIQNKWRNQSLWCWQSEARCAIMPRVFVHTFASIGSVYDSNFTMGELQCTYGGGLRLAVNSSGVNLRGDIAQDINTGEWKWYFTVSEAF